MATTSNGKDQQSRLSLFPGQATVASWLVELVHSINGHLQRLSDPRLRQDNNFIFRTVGDTIISHIDCNLSIFKCKNNIIVSVRRLVDKIVCRRSVG